MRDHEDRHVVWRVVSPPASPCVIAPRSPHGSEHVAAEDPRPDTFESALHEFIVDAGRPSVAAIHLSKRLRRHQPIVERTTTDTERIVDVLTRSGAISVEGDRKAMNSKSRHGLVFTGNAPSVSA